MRYAAILALTLFGSAAHAQSPEDLPITMAWRETLLNRSGMLYDSLYISADKGKLIRRNLDSKKMRARYAECLSARCLADLLTTDLQTWSGDKHLRMVFSVAPRPLPKQSDDHGKSRANETEAMRRRNFGFHNIERLHGNIGLLEIGRFDPAQDAAVTAAAAMQFLANTDALIIDLRSNGGGNADMVAHLMSYFVAEQTHLATMHRRKPEDAVQLWSAAAVGGPRYLDKPIYVLTGKRTFSAAEGLTYDLRHFANAKVVGETTRGGANPGTFQQIDEHFAVFVPTGHMVNQKTKSSWEGAGITPDISVVAAEAKKTAHKMALEELLKVKPQDSRAAMWRQAMEELF